MSRRGAGFLSESDQYAVCMLNVLYLKYRRGGIPLS
jgi:hypothetical protein